ncbi:MAG TPA: BamA/TamA family outer membrane protein, partial [Candidatus Acidoferrales bacterium]|nr:BamA/TamA family outer membrane protein [Candidatus Acidoferrales bacterium]
TSQLNRETQTIRVQFRVREAAPIVVRRIEFTGHRRFSDRYYRRRVLVKEGEEFDLQKLEQGLEQLAREGFVRPATRDDVKVMLDEASRTADVTIHVEEIGRQKISLTGGGIGLGSSLSIAYNVFNILGGEEILTSRIEGGPESLQLLLGLAKDGLFGTKASLGLNVFRNIVQPRLQGRGLFKSRSSGMSAAWSYALTKQDTLAVNYEFSRNATQVPLPVPVLLPGLEVRDVRSFSSRSGVELSWAQESPAGRADASAGVAGGWLGGNERSARTTLTAARLHVDPLSGGRNGWAFRGRLSGASSFGGATLPSTARSFAGEELVRGFRPGELGPAVVTSRVEADGSKVYGTETGGANALVAVNGEYRVPIESHTEVAAFFDAGTSWLVPRWLGGARPDILSGTNGVTRGSAGVEARLRVPVIDQTVRVYYAVNPWRLARVVLLPDGSKFQPTDRRAAFGWALGNLF